MGREVVGAGAADWLPSRGWGGAQSCLKGLLLAVMGAVGGASWRGSQSEGGSVLHLFGLLSHWFKEVAAATVRSTLLAPRYRVGGAWWGRSQSDGRYAGGRAHVGSMWLCFLLLLVDCILDGRSYAGE